MAYDRKKVLAYGIAGVIIALIILVFIPVNKQVNINPYINLEHIPGYGLQYIKVSAEQANLNHIYVTIHTIEIKQPNGEWAKISNKETLWDIIMETEKKLEISTDSLSPGTYSKIRFYIAESIEKSNATLSDGQIIPLGIGANPVEVELTETTINGVDEHSLTLTIGPGVVSNQILPDYHIAIATVKLGGELTTP